MKKIIVCHKQLTKPNTGYSTECDIEEIESNILQKHKGSDIKFLIERTLITDGMIYLFFSVDDKKTVRVL